jgi:hypothetical protein
MSITNIPWKGAQYIFAVNSSPAYDGIALEPSIEKKSDISAMLTIPGLRKTAALVPSTDTTRLTQAIAT